MERIISRYPDIKCTKYYAKYIIVDDIKTFKSSTKIKYICSDSLV